MTTRERLLPNWPNPNPDEPHPYSELDFDRDDIDLSDAPEGYFDEDEYDEDL